MDERKNSDEFRIEDLLNDSNFHDEEKSVSDDRNDSDGFFDTRRTFHGNRANDNFFEDRNSISLTKRPPLNFLEVWDELPSENFASNLPNFGLEHLPSPSCPSTPIKKEQFSLATARSPNSFSQITGSKSSCKNRPIHFIDIDEPFTSGETKRESSGKVPKSLADSNQLCSNEDLQSKSCPHLNRSIRLIDPNQTSLSTVYKILVEYSEGRQVADLIEDLNYKYEFVAVGHFGAELEIIDPETEGCKWCILAKCFNEAPKRETKREKKIQSILVNVVKLMKINFQKNENLFLKPKALKIPFLKHYFSHLNLSDKDLLEQYDIGANTNENNISYEFMGKLLGEEKFANDFLEVLKGDYRREAAKKRQGRLKEICDLWKEHFVDVGEMPPDLKCLAPGLLKGTKNHSKKRQNDKPPKAKKKLRLVPLTEHEISVEIDYLRSLASNEIPSIVRRPRTATSKRVKTNSRNRI